MATRFYLPSVGPAPVTPPALPSGWIAGGTAALQAPAPTTKSNTAFAEFVVAETTASTTNVAVGIFVSEPLAAQTVAGDITAVIRAYGTIGSGNDDALQVGAYLVSGDGTTVKQTLYAGHAAALQGVAATGQLGQEFTSTGGAPGPTRIIPAQALTTQSADSGDRLMLIVGYRTYDVSAGARDSELRFGDPSATADQALTAGLTSDLVPWVELSATLTFAGGASSVTLTPAALHLAAVPLSAQPGPVTVALTPAVVQIAAIPVSPAPQPVTVALTPAGLHLVAVPVVAGSQPVTVALTPAAVHLAAAALSAQPGPVTVTLTPAALALAAVALGISASGAGAFPPVRTQTSVVPIRTSTIR